LSRVTVIFSWAEGSTSRLMCIGRHGIKSPDLMIERFPRNLILELRVTAAACRAR
jgi:hypothetical protein